MTVLIQSLEVLLGEFSFATVAELQAFLGLDAIDEARAELALSGATGAIQAEAQHRIFYVEGDTKKLEGTWGPYLQLPEPPVANVTAVSVANGASVQILAAGGFTFTRRGKLYLGAYSPVINVDYWGYWHGPHSEVTVTYDHGFSAVPVELKALCLQIAGRTFENPGGVESETIGIYSYRSGGASGPDLTEAEKRICWRYRTPL